MTKATEAERGELRAEYALDDGSLDIEAVLIDIIEVVTGLADEIQDLTAAYEYHSTFHGEVD